MSYASELTLACGLMRGQIRNTGRRITNGLWFDGQWRMIGWGDLAEHDLVELAKKLPFGMLFLVVNQTELAPYSYSIDTVAWLIERGAIYQVLRGAQSFSDETYEKMLGVRFRKIIRLTAQQIFARFVRLNSQ